MTAPIPPQKTAYSAAAAEDAILVFVRGRATYTTCRAFGEFLEAAPASGRSRLVIDLSECASLDSTVLGLIAGAAVEFRKNGGEVFLQRATGRTRDVIENLGLPALLTLLPESETAPLPEALAAGETSLPEAAPASGGTILQAHETLMAANPENVARFKDVVAFMREDLKKDLSEERS